jgi:ribosome-associated heat shock protein Hsp15
MTADTQRLDKFLWFCRLAKHRSDARAIAEGRHLRIDGRVVDRAHVSVRVGNVLSFPLHDRVRVIRVTALPARRGPAVEARGCYEDMSLENQAAAPEHIDARASPT